MMATDTEVLARLRLVQGRSDAAFRDFIRGRGQALLTVGADVDCDWCVQEMGVSPIQFSVHWDGSTLRISDTHNSGKVRVDGALLGLEFRRLSGRNRIEFGRAAIVVEAAAVEAEREPGQRQTMPERAPQSNFGSQSAPAAPAGPQSPARPGAANYPGGTTLQHVDQRTVHGYSSSAPAVQVAGSLRIAGAEQGHPPPEPRSRQTAMIAAESPARTEVQQAAPEAGTGLALRSENPGPGRRIMREEAGRDSAVAYEEQSARNPRAVVVLSPVSSLERPDMSAAERSEMDGPSERPSLAVRSSRALPAWGTVGLSLLAIVGGYAGWLYLLYHL